MALGIMWPLPSLRKVMILSYIYMVDELSFCFYYDNGEGTLFQHGSLDKINLWLAKTRADLSAMSDPLYDPNKYIVITASGWDEELINKFIDSRDYIGHWWSEELKKRPTNEHS